MSIEFVEKKFDSYTDLKVVAEDAVGELTLKGWKILAIMSEQVTDSVSGSVPVPNNGSYMTAQATMPLVRGVLRFMMGFDKESVTADLRKQLAALREECTKQSVDIKNLKTAAVNDQLLIKTAAENYETAVRRRDAAHSMTEKMETDLAKLREALGTQQFNAIVSGKEPG